MIFASVLEVWLYGYLRPLRTPARIGQAPTWADLEPWATVPIRFDLYLS